MTSRIMLRCPVCRREKSARRDDYDPPEAATAETICPRCDVGDFSGIEYFDAEGEWVDPSSHLIAMEGRQ